MKNNDFIRSMAPAAYIKAVRELASTGNKNALCKAVYWGVKHFTSEDCIPITNADAQFCYDETAIRLDAMHSVCMLIGQLTPKELMTVFPLRKFYKGQKQGVKDYFYSIDVLMSHGLDNPLGSRVYDILYDYTNIEISLFLVQLGAVNNQLSQSVPVGR